MTTATYESTEIPASRIMRERDELRSELAYIRSLYYAHQDRAHACVRRGDNFFQ